MGDSGEEKPKPLMLEWREFAVDCGRGELKVNDRVVWAGEVKNSDKGTGLNVWDGAVVLAKYLEHAVQMQGANVVELGAGTGVVGLACAALEASIVTITDLEYCLENIRANIALNTELPGQIAALELDWFVDSAADKLPPNVDYVVAADVIWVAELVVPFVSTLRTIADKNPCLKAIYLAHQTRALLTDTQLFEELRVNGFVVTKLDQKALHPSFQSRKVVVYHIQVGGET
mmetsp:Transcript_2308/g.4430  ORF Transcript_2308/g.4430 Transcript_2308/m.4430 type:complete len:231 (+) Transcript_2308:16-708(+)